MDMTQRRCYEQVERTLLKGFVSLLIQPQRSPTSSFTRQQESDRLLATSERIHLDKANPNLLYDEITTIDNALTRPWVVDKTFQRVVSDKPIWFGHGVCREGNNHVAIGNEHHFRSAEGLLMPTKKDQPPPDLRYFTTSKR